MVRAIKAGEAQFFYRASDALPARPVQAVLAFEENGDFDHQYILAIIQADELLRLFHQVAVADGRWWSEVGWMSSRFCFPFELEPPACSVIKASGAPS